RQLLLLVRNHLALAALAEAEALDGLGEDDGGLSLVAHGGCVGGMHLARIVAAAIEPPDLLIRHVGDHRLELRVLPEEVLAGIGAALGLEVLVLAVDAFLHDAPQQALVVAGEERIPTRAPQHLDDVPAGAEEGGLELLDDLAVAAHRAIEALQVTVDYEDEIVEAFTHRHGESAHRLRLVHLTIAEEGPDLAVGWLRETPVLQVADEARLEDRHHGAQAHGDRRKLPEIRHQPGMRIRGEALPGAAGLLAEMMKLTLGEPPLEVGTRVDARR